MRIVFSLVLFKHTLSDIQPLLLSYRDFIGTCDCFATTLLIYDGTDSVTSAVTPKLLDTILPSDAYIYTHGPNLGFGASHNLNFFSSLVNDDDIFLVVNPDICFESSNIHNMVSWFTSSQEVVCLAPLVVSGENLIQHSVKSNPTVLSLLLGRFPFLLFFSILREYNFHHRNLNLSYRNQIIDSPYLSGCFLMVSPAAFRSIGGFDASYFLHLEDADLVRSLSHLGRCVHYPFAQVTHYWARGSHKSLKQQFYLLKSLFVYFSKWGFALF